MVVFIKEKINIISSFAKDILIKDNSTESREGGPAYFIKRFLEEQLIPFKLFTGKKGIVEIDLRNNREKGRIKKVFKINNIIINKNSEFTIISTILDEFTLKYIGNFCCLDIQGYVRNGKAFGKKKIFDSEELEKFDIVKCTEEEMNSLKKERLSKIKLLLITKGYRGCDIFKDGKKFSFKTKRLCVKDTIGAGDTFFIAFCVKYYQTRNISKSYYFAQKEVNKFLMEKEK